MRPRTRAVSCILLFGGVVHSQSTVNLSGLVKSARTGAALEGATVQLVGSTLTTTTSSTGSFQLAGVTGIGARLPSGDARPIPGTGSFRFHQPIEAPVTLSLLDPSGARIAARWTGTLSSGDWLVTPPGSFGGVRLLRIETPTFRETIRILGADPSRRVGTEFAFETIPGSSGLEQVASRSQASAETLSVRRTGYMPARVALASLQQTGIGVGLEDSATSLDDATIVPDPSWPCFMPDGIPPPATGTKVFSVTLQIGAVRKVGLTRFGQRVQYDLTGGSVSGDRLSATVVSGALDYDLTLSDGSKEIEQIVILKAGSTPILMRNAGVAPVGASEARMVLDFEAPNSSAYTWLQTGKYAATRVVDTVAKSIRMDVYDISKSTLPSRKVEVKDPAGAENQSWDCPVQSGGQGTSVLTETVTLANSISIGASKRGSRNIIPITGGTTSGKVVGKILDGGADYQLGGLDARYTLAPNDGEFIIVRNCGSGTLYPVFEARVAGPYNFLNTNKYVSSSPGIVSGGVSITFYEKK